MRTHVDFWTVTVLPLKPNNIDVLSGLNTHQWLLRNTLLPKARSQDTKCPGKTTKYFLKGLIRKPFAFYYRFLLSTPLGFYVLLFTQDRTTIYVLIAISLHSKLIHYFCICKFLVFFLCMNSTTAYNIIPFIRNAMRM